MDRRVAIACSMAAVATFGSACVAVTALGGGLFAGSSPRVAGVERVDIVDDYIVVRSSTTSSTIAAVDSTTVPVVAEVAPPPPPNAPAGAAAPGSAGAKPVVPRAAPAPVGTAPTTRPPAAPATTAATRRTAPPSDARIPADWPASRPIPPMPPGCEQPQLEDNGVWNCQHD